MGKRTAYQNGYEDAQDRGRFASGLPKHTDIDDYNLLRAECEAVREFEAIDRDAYAPAQTAQEVAAWAGRHRVAKLKMTQARAATDAAGILKGAGT